MRIRVATALAILGVLLAARAGAASAQSAELRLDEGPYYAGVPIDILVGAEGFDEDPQPECTAPKPEKGDLIDLGAGQPSVRSFLSITPAGRHEEREVSHRHHFRFLCQDPGRYRLGPFTMTQGEKSAKTRTVQVKLEVVPLTDDMRLRVVVPERPLFVGERAPMRLEWWVLHEQAESLLSLSRDFVVPLFDRADLCTFVDREARDDEQEIVITSGGKPQKIAATFERRTADGKSWDVVVAERILVPLAAGEHELGEATVTVDQVTEWRRDLFGGKRATRAKKVRAVDLARRLSVKELPVAGRPESFAGAVGHGFTLEAAADRTVVQVGDPITLTFTLRGEGGIEQAGLPSLVAGGGLSPAHFRVPAMEEAAGILQDDGGKVFTAVIRVISEAVREIPPIAYGWFDTESGAYETTHSRPIALAVRAGTTISAGDVESAVASAAENGNGGRGGNGARNESGGREQARAELVPGRPIFALTGADLAIARGEAVLVDRRARGGGADTLALLYAASLAALGGAVVVRRRSAIDPALVRRRKSLKAHLQEIENCGGLPRRRALERIAGALRAMLAEAPAARTPEAERAIADCELVRYAPAAGAEPPLDADFHARALECARAILRRGSE
ncbi:MAG: hypothetical protein L0Z55_08980 [Planctomycetes bacterium]|nr:hypothetical protein [Planctomycetota bacterium]